MQIPTDYLPGYEKAKLLDKDLADAFVAHTMIGDPVADAAMEALEEYETEEQHELIQAGLENDEDKFRDAPDALKEFLEVVSNPPPHIVFDPDKALPGTLAFYRDSDMFLVGLALESLTGLSEGLAKAFYVTERALNNLRRFKQNTRHIIEITLPGGMDRFGDGWKLSVRIRLVHSRVRRLLYNSEHWDIPAEGIPLHMAHMGMASTGFSMLNLQSARKLGVKLTEEESEGFMHIWHYVAWLFGVPDRLLQYMESEASARYFRNIALTCECPPGPMATAVAKGYIGAVPDILQVEDEEREKLMRTLFRVARALVGDKDADALNFPKMMTVGTLPLVKMQRKMRKKYANYLGDEQSFAFKNFFALLQQSVYDDTGISYRMPDAVKESATVEW